MLILMLLVSSLGCIFLCVLYLKAKSDISFLEAKCADFLNREEYLMNLSRSITISHDKEQQNIKDGDVEMDVPYNQDEVLKNKEDRSVIKHKELIEVDLDLNSYGFLDLLGISDSQQQDHIEIEPELDNLHQLALFSDSELSTLAAPSLETPGLHFWTGDIIQKYSDDLVAVTNGSYTYHLSHHQFKDFDSGESVYLQVVVGGDDEYREVIMVWQPEIAEIPA